VARVIAVVNQKGGVGKSTTAVNVSAYLASFGRRTLLVDTDPQGNASSGVGVRKESLRFSIYDSIINEVPIASVITSTAITGLDVVPATLKLAGAEVELVAAMSRETRLAQCLEPVLADYDFVFVDCPPSLGLLTVNALVAANSLLIPVQCEYYALEGLGQLLDTVALVQRHLNRDLTIVGFLMTMHDSRTNLSQQVIEDVRNHYGDKVFKTVIPRNVTLSEAPSFGMPIIQYDPKSRGAIAYEELAKEVLERG
jgi:chromosome partitioning protein